MFRNLVKNTYIGKSQLNFIYQGNEISGESTIEAIGYPLLIPGGSHYLPDWFIPGYLNPVNNTFTRVTYEKSHRVNLYITGIPKGVASLDPWRLNHKLWSSYYEDDYRGYLFQILPSNKPLKFISE